MALSAEDRLSILELISRYAWTIDLGDLEACVALFTEDGVFDGQSGYFAGRDRLREFVREVHEGSRARGLQHWTANQVFQEQGDRVVVMSMSAGLRRIEGEHALVFVGYYVDTFERTGAGWRFKVRRWRPWEGDVLDLRGFDGFPFATSGQSEEPDAVAPSTV